MLSARPASALSPSIDNEDELLQLQALLGDDFNEIAELFLRDSPARLDSLRAAEKSADLTSLARTAHVLCGSSSSIGATNLSRLCRDVEVAAKNVQRDQSSARVQAVEAEYARVASRIREMTSAH